MSQWLNESIVHRSSFIVLHHFYFRTSSSLFRPPGVLEVWENYGF
jgi:hypothetical protein